MEVLSATVLHILKTFKECVDYLSSLVFLALFAILTRNQRMSTITNQILKILATMEHEKYIGSYEK